MPLRLVFALFYVPSARLAMLVTEHNCYPLLANKDCDKDCDISIHLY